MGHKKLKLFMIEGCLEEIIRVRAFQNQRNRSLNIGSLNIKVLRVGLAERRVVVGGGIWRWWTNGLYL